MQISPTDAGTKVAGITEAVAAVAGNQKETAIQSAVSHVAGQKKAMRAVEASPSSKLIRARKEITLPVSKAFDSTYQKQSGADAKSSKEVKNSIDSVVGREPIQAGRGVLDEVAELLTPPPQTLETAATDVFSVYTRGPQASLASKDPASFYRGAGLMAMGSPEEMRRNPAGMRDESANPIQAYANKEVYHSRTDAATGQKIATFGNEETSLTGRIQKMYQNG